MKQFNLLQTDFQKALNLLLDEKKQIVGDVESFKDTMNQIQIKMDRQSKEIKKSLNILNNQISTMVSSSYNWNKKISAVVQEFENSLELLKKIKSQLTK